MHVAAGLLFKHAREKVPCIIREKVIVADSLRSGGKLPFVLRNTRRGHMQIQWSRIINCFTLIRVGANGSSDRHERRR